MSRRHRLVLAGLAPFFSASTVAPLLAFVSFTSFTAIASAQTTWYVDDDASPDGNGLGWTTAYRYLQDALAEASAGDEIHVAGGIYRPDQDEAGNTIPGDRVATFQLLTGVALSGGYAGLANTTYPDQRDIEAYRSILTGDLDGDDVPVACTQDSPDCDDFGNRCVDGLCIIRRHDDENAYHVVTGGGTDATAIVDGLTISNGNADDLYAPHGRGAGLYNFDPGSPTLRNCTFRWNSARRHGGGIYNRLSSPAISNCAFYGNSAASGGAMNNSGNSNPTVTDCTFTSNSAARRDGFGGYGGAMSNGDSSPMVVNCIFSDNSASNGCAGMADGGDSTTLTGCTFIGNWTTALTGVGGGMCTYGTTATVTNCTFSGNTASSGGGMYNSGSSPTITDCTFTGNAAGAHTSFGGGGGMYNWSSSTPIVINCTFSGNVSDKRGGGMYSNQSIPVTVNCTFSRNTATIAGGGLFSIEGHQTVTNCILWGNLPDEAATWPGTVTYSVIQGGWPGDGNVNADPLFVDADGVDDVPGTQDDDLRLLAGSPAIDAADNTAVPIGVTTDLDGNPRFVDDPASPDTGNGTPPIIDMGAYEFQCGNGVVDPGEECDDGGESVACDADCTVPECGDGRLNTTAGEECDDGRDNSDTEPDACRTGCRQAWCGDGVVDTSEECDDGDGNSDTVPDACRTTCVAPTCGDGVVDAAEECDDGNTESDDACDESCQSLFGACCVGTVCGVTLVADCFDSGGVFFGVRSTCGAPDADGDGLRNECDGCPNDPNKIEPGICGCGLDDNADSDGDGVPDCDDQCLGADDTVFAPNCIDTIPTVSGWGLIVMLLLLLTALKIPFAGRRTKRA